MPKLKAEEALDIALQRLRHLQSCDQACIPNAVAISHIEEAIAALRYKMPDKKS